MGLDFSLCYKKEDIFLLCNFVKENYTELCNKNLQGISMVVKKQILNTKLSNPEQMLKLITENRWVSVIVRFAKQVIGASIIEPKTGKILFLGANFSGLQEQVLRALMKKIIDINIFNVNVDKYKIDAIMGYVEIYEKIGFTKTAEEVTINGITFTHMEYNVDQSGIENDNL